MCLNLLPYLRGRWRRFHKPTFSVPLSHPGYIAFQTSNRTAGKQLVQIVKHTNRLRSRQKIHSLRLELENYRATDNLFELMRLMTRPKPIPTILHNTETRDHPRDYLL